MFFWFFSEASKSLYDHTSPLLEKNPRDRTLSIDLLGCRGRGSHQGEMLSALQEEQKELESFLLEQKSNDGNSKKETLLKAEKATKLRQF